MDQENAVCTCSRILLILKNKKMLSYAAVWMKLEGIMLSGIWQLKDNHCIILLSSKVIKFIEAGNKLVIWGWWRVRWELLLSGHSLIHARWKKSGDLLYNNVHMVKNTVLYTSKFKRVNFMLCSYHNFFKKIKKMKWQATD